MTEVPDRTTVATHGGPTGDAVETDLVRRARSRRLASGIAASLLSRGGAAASQLLLIPVTLAYLGSEVYGLWMATAALAGMIGWADFGLGNGLLTKLAPCHARGDWDTARRYVSTAYATLGAVAVILLCLVWGLSEIVPWASMLNVDEAGIAPLARTITLATLTAMIINIPLSLVQRVQYAYQQVAQSNLWLAAGSLSSVGLAWVAVRLEGSPTIVVAAAVSGPLLSNIVNSVFVYLGRGRLLRPRPSAIDRHLARSLVQLAGQFFVLSIVTTAALNADNLIIAHARGLTAVTEFSVPAKVFAALGLMVSLVNMPLWPANGEALARGDIAWVRRVTNRMTVMSAGAVILASLILLAGGGAVVSILAADDAVGLDPPLALGLAAWWACLASASPRFMVQNAAGIVRPQLIGWAAFFVTSIPIKWIAAQSLGIAAVPFAGAALYLLCVWPGAQAGFGRALAAHAVKPSLGVPAPTRHREASHHREDHDQ